MAYDNIILAQWDVGPAVAELVLWAGVVIVPGFVWGLLRWFRRGRRMTVITVGPLAVLSLLFLIWSTIAILNFFYPIPSVDEDMAVEEVESAFRVLDTSRWDYSAKHPTKDVWIITVYGHTKSGQSINEIFRVTDNPLDFTTTVEEAETSETNGWKLLYKRCPPPLPSTTTSGHDAFK